MKAIKLFTIFLFISLTSFTQVTKVESISIIDNTIKEHEILSKELFSHINKYRKSKGLKEIKWRNDIYQATKHHSTYLCYVGESKLITHVEDKESDKISKLQFPKDRAINYIPDYINGDILFENVALELRFDNIISPTIFLDMWKKSTGHNKVLIDKNIYSGACSIVSIEVNTNVGKMFVTYVTFIGWEGE
jgi:uncharacterized protein YkwD